MHNSLIYNLFLQIALTLIYQLSKGLKLPARFPRTTYEFYKLKSLS